MSSPTQADQECIGARAEDEQAEQCQYANGVNVDEQTSYREVVQTDDAQADVMPSAQVHRGTMSVDEETTESPVG